MQETETPPSECPHCGYKVDRASSTKGDAIPKSGDISICLKCAGVNAYTDSLGLRRLTLKEQIDLQCSPVWPHIEKVRYIIKTVRKKYE